MSDKERYLTTDEASEKLINFFSQKDEPPTGFPRLNNELTKYREEPSTERWREVLGIKDPSEKLKTESVSVIEPQHYRNPNSKYVDKYDQWYHEHDLATFRAIMRAIAERYTTRYESKNGVIDLEKGIYTLTRLKEYEEREEE